MTVKYRGELLTTEELKEIAYWNNDFSNDCYDEQDGCDWSDD